MRAATLCQVFVAAKPGEAETSCQDVAHIDAGHSPDAPARFVVCDGVSGAFNSRRWAELVSDEVFRSLASWGSPPAAGFSGSDLDAAIETARARWDAEHSHLGSAEDPLAALAHTKLLETGGQATLLAGFIGPAVPGDTAGPWGLALINCGDCNLFVLRLVADDHVAIASTPAATSEDFDSTPQVVCSKRGLSELSESSNAVSIDKLRAGDVVLVTTDAVAQWALRRHELGAPVWSLLARMDAARFRKALELARANAEIVPDDVLVARFILGGGA